MKLKLIASAMVLLVLAIGFNTMFNLAALDKLYMESTISEYRVIGNDLQRTLENALRFGKNLRRFYGMTQLLIETKHSLIKKVAEKRMTTGDEGKRVSEVDFFVSVALPDGLILHSADSQLVSTQLPEPVRVDYKITDNQTDSSTGTDYRHHRNGYFITLPVRDLDQTWVATIVIQFDEKQAKAHYHHILKQNIRIIAIVLLCAMLLLFIGLYCTIPPSFDLQIFPKKKIYLIMFTIIGLAQMVCSGLSTYAFKEHYLRMNKEKMEITTGLLKEDIEYVLNQGIQIDRLFEIESWMKDFLTTSPALKHIAILDKNERPLYKAAQKGGVDLQKTPGLQKMMTLPDRSTSDPDYDLHLNIMNSQTLEGFISARISKKLLFDRVYDIALDFMTVIVVSILFLVELVILIFKFIERRVDSIGQTSAIHYSVMRPAAFLFLFGIDISISFIPLHMEKLYEPIFGFSRDMITGLPISVEFLFVGLAIFISGVWLDRRGWHEPFLGGLFLAGMGVLYSWRAPDALHFIASRGIAGFGYGLTLMASQGFVITYSDRSTMARGLAHLFAGFYAGSICGGATGAMLAERIGYHPVFLSGAVILFAVIFYTVVVMRNAFQKPEIFLTEKTLPSARKGRFWPFISNRAILSLILFSSLPAAIAVVGFMNYFSPVYLNRIGASQSTIGRTLMIYGVCMIYIGPFIGQYVDASRDKRPYIVLGCVLGSLAFLTFYFLKGLLAAVVALFLLGLSSSCVLASQSAYALGLKVTRELGEGKAIGVFRATSRVGQALGPIIFGGIMLSTNINEGITYFGLAYLLAALLFLLLTQRTQETLITEDA